MRDAQQSLSPASTIAQAGGFSEEWGATLERRFAEVETRIRSYLPDADLSSFRRAFEFACSSHCGQMRKSGEPYIGHPLEVAAIVAELRLGVPSLCAALLHDTVEDTPATLEDLADAFGEQVAFLVSGLTKLSKIEFQSREEHQAENLRKLIVAMTRDLRVVLIKLADRLHNIRTLQHMRPDKQKRIASETLEIYAPLAGRLGINWLKNELEDESLKYLDPSAYQELKQRINQKKSERDDYIWRTTSVLNAMLEEHGIEAQVSGRPKHFYSMYRKMKRSGIEFDEIYDITAFRIIVADKAACYNVLGLVHDRWRPVAGRFKDYVAVPKTNGYQSLHTTVVGPSGERVEIQIRTEEMHRTAEYGVAAHWAYKEGRDISTSDTGDFAWMRALVESHAEINDSREYLESVKLDLFDDEVFVFTPNGDIKALPRGATPLDFAYAIHTEVGDHCVHARVNNRQTSLRHILENGDVVEIITREDQHPREEWLEFAKSARARSKIRAYIGAEKRERARKMGEEMVTAELKKHGLRYSSLVRDGKMGRAAEQLKFQNVDQMMIDIGYGRHQPELLTRYFVPNAAERTRSQESGPNSTVANTGPQRAIRRFGERLRSLVGRTEARSVHIVGLKGDVMTSFARCCDAVPGEPIVGYVTRGRGIVVHARDCDRLDHLESERLVEVDWDQAATEGDREERRRARVRITSHDEPGILSEMSQAFTERGVDIAEARCRSRGDGMATSTFEVLVTNAGQLGEALKHVGRVEGVVNVERMHH